jgi:hypothetical protein
VQPAGGVCHFVDGECTTGTACIVNPDGRAGVCRAPGGAGDPCFTVNYYSFFQAPACRPGLFCDWRLSPPVCAAPLAAGDTCATTDSCAPPLACVGVQQSIIFANGAVSPASRPGKCAPRSGSGGPCVMTASDPGCTMYQECKAGICTRTQPTLGEACRTAIVYPQCIVGYCNLDTLVCTDPGSDGALCDPTLGGRDCLTPADCDTTYSTCKGWCPGW